MVTTIRRSIDRCIGRSTIAENPGAGQGVHHVVAVNRVFIGGIALTVGIFALSEALLIGGKKIRYRALTGGCDGLFGRQAVAFPQAAELGIAHGGIHHMAADFTGVF